MSDFKRMKYSHTKKARVSQFEHADKITSNVWLDRDFIII